MINDFIYKSKQDFATIRIKAIPKASRNYIGGVSGDRLKVFITEAPEKGKANASVIELLSDRLSIPKSDFEIIMGATSSKKNILIKRPYNDVFGKLAVLEEKII